MRVSSLLVVIKESRWETVRKSLEKRETVRGINYISVRVRVGLRGRNVNPGHRRVAHVEVTEHILVHECSIGFHRAGVISRHAR